MFKCLTILSLLLGSFTAFASQEGESVIVTKKYNCLPKNWNSTGNLKRIERTSNASLLDSTDSLPFLGYLHIHSKPQNTLDAFEFDFENSFLLKEALITFKGGKALTINYDLYHHYQYVGLGIIRLNASSPFGDKSPVGFMRHCVSPDMGGRYCLKWDSITWYINAKFVTNKNIEVSISSAPYIYKVYRENLIGLERLVSTSQVTDRIDVNCTEIDQSVARP